jgi:Ca-activated chloride channel family protein
MAWIAIALVAQSADAQPLHPEGELEERTKARLREVRLRIRPDSLAPPGACRDLGLDELKVSVRGRPVEQHTLLELERERRPTLHALLIDTSGSAAGKLDYFRSTAAGYVGRLRPDRDRALVATFDENVVLVQPPTADHERLIEAIHSVRMGHSTALNDGLYFIMRELEAHSERPVLLLITDGFDTTSMRSRDEVNSLATRRSDQTVFTIGVAVPELTANGPPGLVSTKRFLQRLAARTNGRYFDVHTGGRLDRAFARIHEMLENEALLTFLDPDPDAEPGRIKVSSLDPDCKIDLFRTAPVAEPTARHDSIRPPFPDPPRSFALPAARAYSKYYRGDGKGALDPDCRGSSVDETDEALWFLEVEARRIHGCALDVTVETGIVYAAESVLRMRTNGWLRQKTRPFEFEVPRPRDLPTRVEQLMPALADHAVAVADDPVENAPLQIPVELHARPYHDYPMLLHGKTFLDLRPSLARALFSYPEYRAWTGEKLREQAGDELEELKRRFSSRTQTRDPSILDAAARQSREGREILRRAERPTAVDLESYLAAWLGDVSAHELFARWEIDRINALLEDGPDAVGFDEFRERWSETRRIFFVPSYARILTLLSPVLDEEQGRIGYWRVVLPRASWMLRRVKGYRKRTDYADLPMDLLPDLPLALWVVDRTRAERGAIFETLERGGYRVVETHYELLGKPYRHDPRRGFRETRIEVLFHGAGPNAELTELRLIAEVRLDDDRPTLVALDLSYPAGLHVHYGFP